jgi:hypothetical protein
MSVGYLLCASRLQQLQARSSDQHWAHFDVRASEATKPWKFTPIRRIIEFADPDNPAFVELDVCIYHHYLIICMTRVTSNLLEYLIEPIKSFTRSFWFPALLSVTRHHTSLLIHPSC